ncbi:MAG: thiopurine S-methyltransferase, partial [Ketobacter sp.]
ELTGALLGPVDAIYDRAALVALPPAMRAQYSAHLIEITSSAPQLLITFEYDQDAIDGPPFSLDTEEINRQYADKYNLHAAQTRPVDGGLKGKIEATETAWLLRRNC